MIEIKNQILVKISIGPFEDFIMSTDLLEFKYVEQAGMVRPYLFLRFMTYDTDVMQYLNEGNIVNVSFGRTSLDTVDKQFIITGVDHVTTESSLVIQLHALLYIPEFMEQVKSMNYADKTSLDLVKEIAGKYFNTVDTSTISKTQDKQTWRQDGISDYAFLKNNVWFHSYINENTFIMSAMTNDKFYFKDVKNTISKEEPWIFIPVGMSKDSTKIINYSTYSNKNNFGLTNNMIGKGKINHTFDFLKGQYTTTNSKLNNYLIIDSSKVNLNEQNCKNIKFTYRTEQHPYYNTAYDQNTRNLLMFGNYNVYISFAGQYKQIELLQPATVLPTVLDTAAMGTFLVDTICYQITDKRLWVNTTLTKEAFSTLKGDSLS